MCQMLQGNRDLEHLVPAPGSYNHPASPPPPSMEQNECSPLSQREMQTAPFTLSCGLLPGLVPLEAAPDISTSRERLTQGTIQVKVLQECAVRREFKKREVDLTEKTSPSVFEVESWGLQALSNHVNSPPDLQFLQPRISLGNQKASANLL